MVHIKTPPSAPEQLRRSSGAPGQLRASPCIEYCTEHDAHELYGSVGASNAGGWSASPAPRSTKGLKMVLFFCICTCGLTLVCGLDTPCPDPLETALWHPFSRPRLTLLGVVSHVWGVMLGGRGAKNRGKHPHTRVKPPVRKISVQITVRDTVEIRCDRRGSGSKRCLSPWATLRSRRWQDAPSRPACPIAWILLRSVGGRRALRAAAMRGSTRAAVELPRGCAEHRRGHGVCG